MWLIPPQLFFAAKSPSNDKNSPPPYVTIQPAQVITPTVAPAVVDRVNITTAADFLWWKSYLGGLEYAMSGIAENNLSTQVSIDRGSVKKPPFRFAPGVKLLLGINYQLDGFDSAAIYTGLYSDKERTSVHYDATKGLLSTISIQAQFFDPYTSLSDATCTWRQEFNVLDLELGRNFFISTNLTLRPQLGMKLSWIEEKFHVHYDYGYTPGLLSTDTEFNQKQWGIGVRGGVETVWHFTKEIGLFGTFAISALWSDFSNHILQIASGDSFDPPSATQNTDGHVYDVIPVMEMSLGFQGMVWFNKETCLFFARAGWERQIWCDFNQFAFPMQRASGNLSLQGLTARIGFTY